MTPADLSAVLVTRGNIDPDPTTATFDEAGVGQVIVWDNSARPENLGVFGRYAALAEVVNPAALVCDDDVILPAATIEALAAAYEPGRLVANMPAAYRTHYTDSCLVGFGAVFDVELPEMAFARFSHFWNEPDAHLTRRCDVIFTALTPQTWVDLPYVEREFARAPDRMYRQPNHHRERKLTLGMARKARRPIVA